MENLHNGNQAVALVNPGGAFDFSDVQPGRYALLLANAAVLKPVFRSVKIKASSRSSIAFAVIFWISFSEKGRRGRTLACGALMALAGFA
jgi:hypothetical protein